MMRRAYVKQLGRTALRDSWRFIVPHNLIEGLRSVTLTAAPFVVSFLIGPELVRGNLMSPDNVKDTLAWLVLGLAGLGSLWVAVFLIHLLFITPYRLWRELTERLAQQKVGSETVSARARRVSAQEKFPLWEAACLFANSDLETEPKGEALAYLYQLKALIADGQIKRTVYASGDYDFSASLSLGGLISRDQRIAGTPNNAEVNRGNLLRAAKLLKVSIPGLTDVGQTPRLLPGTEVKTQP